MKKLFQKLIHGNVHRYFSLQNGKFFSTVGFDGFILSILCAGMSPFTSMCELILQVLLMSPMRLVSACYLISFRKTIENCMQTRDQNKKSN